jgi:hypothetical protein
MSPALAFNYPQLRRIEHSLARVRDLPAMQRRRMASVIAALEVERSHILRDSAHSAAARLPVSAGLEGPSTMWLAEPPRPQWQLI